MSRLFRSTGAPHTSARTRTCHLYQERTTKPKGPCTRLMHTWDLQGWLYPYCRDYVYALYIYLDPFPKAPCTDMVTTWASKVLLYHDFEAYVHTIVVLGAFGFGKVLEIASERCHSQGPKPSSRLLRSAVAASGPIPL